jgi:hypothetical protein
VPALDRPPVRALARAALVIACAAALPRAICGCGAGGFFRGDLEAQDALARAVAADVTSGVSVTAFHSGNARFDGEWLLVTHQMAALGLGQVILEHPERKQELLPAVEASAERLLGPDVAAFGVASWGKGALDDLPSDNGHAYLGYSNMAFSMLRLLSPENPLAKLNDEITAAFVRRLEAAPYGLIDTYPGAAYPPDVGSVIGSIGLYDRATGADHQKLLQRWSALFRAHYREPSTGLAYQKADGATGKPLGGTRGSGTAILVYFLSFADPALSRELFQALQSSQQASFLGFGGVREYGPRESGWGDIDSGPVLFGAGVSASGFSLAGARSYGDEGMFTRLYRTVDLFGVPVAHGEGRHFMSGGPIGNAILLAMLTAAKEHP